MAITQTVLAELAKLEQLGREDDPSDRRIQAQVHSLRREIERGPTRQVGPHFPGGR